MSKHRTFSHHTINLYFKNAFYAQCDAPDHRVRVCVIGSQYTSNQPQAVFSKKYAASYLNQI